MKIIFGLGNPGLKYKNTRHNIGFKVVDRLAGNQGLRFKRSFKLNAYIAKFRVNKEDIVLVKPHTYMNRSGACVGKILRYYKVSPEDCLIIYDDVDLPLGILRLRVKGSAGGHRGMSSIIETVDSEVLNRLRIGIDKPVSNVDLSDYVLSEFSSKQMEALEEAVSKAVSACIDWVNLGNDYVMKNYN